MEASVPSPLFHGIGHKIYSFNIVYNTKTFPTGKHPRSWAEVWDGQKFKGGRSFNFRGGISPQLEIALLADGVPMDKLYPIDIERAWKSTDRLRPLVTKWYQSHAEAIQLADNTGARAEAAFARLGLARLEERHNRATAIATPAPPSPSSSRPTTPA